MVNLTWHPSLKKTFKGCEEWWQSSMVKRDKRGAELVRLRDDLAREGKFKTDGSTLSILAQTYSTEACLLGQKGDIEGAGHALVHAVAFRSLNFLRPALASARDASRSGMLPFWSSMEAIGPTMLSDWLRGNVCASALISLGEKDMLLNIPEMREKGWGKGTNDAFLIYLLSDAYGITTHYEPTNPLVEPYSRLLNSWRTTDEAEFNEAMSDAADFHISRSKDGTDRSTYEFEDYFDRVFPGELCAVQALRLRDGLPDFKTGHSLVDTPWMIVSALKATESHPLASSLVERLRPDYPEIV